MSKPSQINGMSIVITCRQGQQQRYIKSLSTRSKATVHQKYVSKAKSNSTSKVCQQGQKQQFIKSMTAGQKQKYVKNQAKSMECP